MEKVGQTGKRREAIGKLSEQQAQGDYRWGALGLPGGEKRPCL